jgi:hypothetical protein
VRDGLTTSWKVVPRNVFEPVSDEAIATGERAFDRGIPRWKGRVAPESKPD